MYAAIDDSVWRPTPKQQEFLAAPEEEVLYGGAAGGGKTDALIVDALGLNQIDEEGAMAPAIQHPRYRALLIRPEYGELKEVSDRMKELYPRIVKGAEYVESAREWRFPSGAKIYLGYLKDENDKLKYRSFEFQYLGWEELTQHPTQGGYDYLSYSRVRGMKGLKKYVRATSNPDGPGHDWVKEKWRIPDEGTPTSFSVRAGKMIMRRRFIPAKVADNPHIDDEYASRLEMLSEQERIALLDGSWANADFRGAIFKPQLAAAYESGRVLDIPVETRQPVNTFWDMGSRDRTAIWFMQRVGVQNRFIDYYEAEQQTLSHFAGVLKSKGYIYDMHYLPHDAAHVRQNAWQNESLEEILNKLGVRPTRIVQRADSKKAAIELGRQAFASAYFDENRCRVGLSRLRGYRYKFDMQKNAFAESPLHDVNSNGADAFLQYAQGYRPYGFSAVGQDTPREGRKYREIFGIDDNVKGDVLC